MWGDGDTADEVRILMTETLWFGGDSMEGRTIALHVASMDSITGTP